MPEQSTWNSAPVTLKEMIAHAEQNIEVYRILTDRDAGYRPQLDFWRGALWAYQQVREERPTP